MFGNGFQTNFLAAVCPVEGSELAAIALIKTWHKFFFVEKIASQKKQSRSYFTNCV
jgi:hypothetical protein